MNNEERELLKALSIQVAELREMNVTIIREAAFIQSALNTLITIDAGANPGALGLYNSHFLSVRETIAAAMEHLGLQQALHDFLETSQAGPELAKLSGPTLLPTQTQVLEELGRVIISHADPDKLDKAA